MDKSKLINKKLELSKSYNDDLFDSSPLISKNNAKTNHKSAQKYKLFEGYLVFEGEYINGMRIKGKEYYKNGNLKFEGDYLNGEKWNGKGYHKKKKKYIIRIK